MPKTKPKKTGPVVERREALNIDQFRTSPPEPPAPTAAGVAAKGVAVDPADRLCLAKAEPKRDGVVWYSAVVSTDGRRKLFDPREDDPHFLGRHTETGPRWKMARVTQDTYELYAKYLRTDNLSFYREAQRNV